MVRGWEVGVRVDFMGAQTGTSDNSHTADFTPCHRPPHLKQIYTAVALLLDRV